MDMYQYLGRIGEGAHGLVFRARNTVNGKDIALKKIRIRRARSRFPLHVVREIKNLQFVDCEYVVELLDVQPQGQSCVLAFEFMPSGLTEVLHDPDIKLTGVQIKTYMYMLLCGMEYLHGYNIMHRDLKPSNLVIDRNGILKIADFGLSRIYNESNSVSYSHQVATRWYRAPELLYGSRNYDKGVDMWSIGCIFAEMFTNIPVFHGETDIEQLMIVLNALGTPNEDKWPGVTKLPDFNKIAFPDSDAKPIEKIVRGADQISLGIIKTLIQYDSTKRPSAKELLLHHYFHVEPWINKRLLPKPGENHRKKFCFFTEYDFQSEVGSFFEDFNMIVLFGT